MKKLKTYIIPIIILVIFVAIMTTGGLLKKPFSESDDVLKYVEAVKEDITNENWDEAESNVKKIRSSWEKVEKRVQFSVERNEMIEMDNNIARLEGAISAKDKSSSLIELSEIMEHWRSLEK